MSVTSAVKTTPAKPPRPNSLLDAVPFALLLITVAGSCGYWHWFQDLCAHYRWYYFVIAVGWSLYLWKRWRSWQMAALAITLLWNGGLLLPFYLPSPGPVIHPTDPRVSLISLNVFTQNTNKEGVVKYLRERNPDLIVAMEVNERWENALKELKDVYPYQFIQPRADNFGIGLLSKWPLIEPWFFELAETEIPNFRATIERDGRKLLIVATHPLPPIGANYTRERNAQLRALADFVANSKLPCLVAGDFNATPWSTAYRDFSSRSGLRDSSLGYGIQGSWNAKSWLIRIPIDQVFLPPNVGVIRRSLGPDVGSDHYPVETTIAITGM